MTSTLENATHDVSAAIDIAFLDDLFANRDGYVAVALGYNGRWEGTTYGFPPGGWVETRYAWPAGRELMVRELNHELTSRRVDLYYCPALRVSDARNGFGGKHGTNALPPNVLWADCDETPDPRQIDELGAIVVESGREGHLHVYVPLAETVSVAVQRRLNQALARWLGADAKWSDDVVLRIPGTLNHKTDPPGAVVAQPGRAEPWDVDKLAALLGADLAAPEAERQAAEGVAPEPLPDPLPVVVREALERPANGDRSTAHHALISTIWGGTDFTLGQAVAVAERYGPSVDKYGPRLAAEVARSWAQFERNLALMTLPGLSAEEWADYCARYPAGNDAGEEAPQDGEKGGEDAPPRSTWEPVDIGEILADGYEPPTPDLFPRTDGICLFYRGKVHAIYGESESGKSWVVQILSAQTLVEGGRVLYIDHEDHALSVAGRLLALGVPREVLIDPDRYVYVRPEGPRDAAFLRLLDRQYDVAAVDGVNVAISAESASASSDSTDDAARWYATVPDRIADRTGAATVTVDHVTKSRDSRGRFPIGSQAKLSAVSGSAFLVRVDTPFARGQVGTLILRSSKDRPGGVRPHCGPADACNTQEAARVVLDATDPEALKVSVEPWSPNARERGEVPDGDDPTRRTDDWNDPLRWPLPEDIRSYSGRGKKAIDHVAAFLRQYAVGGIGVNLAGLMREMRKIQDPATGKPVYDRKTVERAWGALIDMARLEPVNPQSSAPTTYHYWMPREGDPE